MSRSHTARLAVSRLAWIEVAAYGALVSAALLLSLLGQKAG
jgi:hypothetical protein